MANRFSLLLTLLLIVLALDFYIYKAILGARTSWSGAKRKRFIIGWWAITILFFIGISLSIYFNIRLTIRAIILVGFFLSFVAKVFFALFLLIDDVRRLAIWAKRKLLKTKTSNIAGEPIKRSDFLLKAGTITAALPLTSLSFGIISGAYDYKIVRQQLYLANLPKVFDGLTLGQISDIHSGSFYDRKAVLGGVEMLLKEKPDLIFFTGDLVNNIASEMREYQDIFSKVKAPLGVYSVLGNHDYGDYYFGRGPSAAKAKSLADVKQTHKNMGWDLLLNEHRSLKVGGEEIGILGIENWGAGRFAKYGRMDLAVQNTDHFPVKLLLSHDPSHWRAQVLENYPQIDAMFSGHTHGMQFGVRTKEFQWSPIEYIYKEWAGLYHEKNQQLYVNVGYGFLGYPGRVGILPEITIFELKSGLAPA
ncbi:MAG: metallophosphoesterase [Sphingobacteriaceae bacterium]